MDRLAGLLALLVLAVRPLEAAVEVIDLRQRDAAAAPGRQLLATNECTSKGLDGTCNACVCCCYAAGAGIMNYEPTDSCTCKRSINSSQVWATVVLSVILVLGGLLVQLYFGGSLPISPYAGPQQRRQREQQRAAGRITPEEQQQQPVPTAAARAPR